jgi:hypothetical protein
VAPTCATRPVLLSVKRDTITTTLSSFQQIGRGRSVMTNIATFTQKQKKKNYNIADFIRASVQGRSASLGYLTRNLVPRVDLGYDPGYVQTSQWCFSHRPSLNWVDEKKKGQSQTERFSKSTWWGLFLVNYSNVVLRKTTFCSRAPLQVIRVIRCMKYRPLAVSWRHFMLVPYSCIIRAILSPFECAVECALQLKVGGDFWIQNRMGWLVTFSLK